MGFVQGTDKIGTTLKLGSEVQGRKGVNQEEPPALGWMGDLADGGHECVATEGGVACVCSSPWCAGKCVQLSLVCVVHFLALEQQHQQERPLLCLAPGSRVRVRVPVLVFTGGN